MAIHTVLGFVGDDWDQGDWGHREEEVVDLTFVCEKGFKMRGSVKLIWGLGLHFDGSK